MGRFVESVCRLCRRAGEKLYLKGEKCYSNSCPVQRRSYPPGQHGKLPQKISEYGIRLREKQKARWIYGLSERQFQNYFAKASKKKGITGEKLMQSLEGRLDNIVYRLGFASSRKEGRQLVRHGHIFVSGRKVDIPSYQAKKGDVISVRGKSQEFLKKNLEKLGERKIPSWLTLDQAVLEGSVLRTPERKDIDTLLEEHLIVEYYSR